MSDRGTYTYSQYDERRGPGQQSDYDWQGTPNSRRAVREADEARAHALEHSHQQAGRDAEG